MREGIGGNRQSLFRAVSLSVIVTASQNHDDPPSLKLWRTSTTGTTYGASARSGTHELSWRSGRPNLATGANPWEGDTEFNGTPGGGDPTRPPEGRRL